MGVKKLANELKITLDEAKALMNKYFKVFPSIKKLMDEFTTQVNKTHVAISPLDGRRRDLTSIDWDNKKHVAHAINIAKNLPFQGSGATVTKLAMCKMRKYINENNLDAKLVLTVHDEILVVANKNISKQVAEILKEKMISAFNHFAPGTLMKVKPDISDHWVH